MSCACGMLESHLELDVKSWSAMGDMAMAARLYVNQSSFLQTLHAASSLLGAMAMPHLRRPFIRRADNIVPSISTMGR